jgi:hypothetical protein
MGEGTDDADHAGTAVDALHDDAPIDSSPVDADQVDADQHEAEPIDTTPDDGQLIAAARRRHGALGGIVAAGMLGIDKVLGRKPREEIPVVVAAPTEPIDIDADGITVALDADTDVVSPPLPRTAPKIAPTRRRRR